LEWANGERMAVVLPACVAARHELADILMLEIRAKSPWKI